MAHDLGLKPFGSWIVKLFDILTDLTEKDIITIQLPGNNDIITKINNYAPSVVNIILNIHICIKHIIFYNFTLKTPQNS